MNATLVYSSKWSQRDRILSYSDDSFNSFTNKLIDTVFHRKSNRVVIKDGKYHYTPTNEYRSFVVRMKGIR